MIQTLGTAPHPGMGVFKPGQSCDWLSRPCLKFSLPPSCRSSSRRSFRLHRREDVRWPWTHPWLRDGWMGWWLGTTLRRIWRRLRIRRWIRTLWKLVISQLLQLWWWLVILRQPLIATTLRRESNCPKIDPLNYAYFIQELSKTHFSAFVVNRDDYHAH